MTGHFRCKFLECNIKGKVILKKNEEVETIYEGNDVNHYRGPNASFFSRQIQGLKCESAGRDVIHEKNPSKIWHEKLKDVPDESFEAGNITEAGCSKASYETIKREQVVDSTLDSISSCRLKISRKI